MPLSGTDEPGTILLGRKFLYHTATQAKIETENIYAYIDWKLIEPSNNNVTYSCSVLRMTQCIYDHLGKYDNRWVIRIPLLHLKIDPMNFVRKKYAVCVNDSTTRFCLCLLSRLTKKSKLNSLEIQTKNNIYVTVLVFCYFIYRHMFRPILTETSIHHIILLIDVPCDVMRGAGFPVSRRIGSQLRRDARPS